MRLRSYALVALTALCLSFPAYAADKDDLKDKGRHVDASAERQMPKIHITRDTTPIDLGFEFLNVIASEFDFLHRYVERRDVVRENDWERPIEHDRFSTPLPYGPINPPKQNMMERRAIQLGAALSNKGIDYLLRKKLNTPRDTFDINFRPTPGGVYLGFRVLLP